MVTPGRDKWSPNANCGRGKLSPADYIFYFQTQSKRQDMKKFIIYSTMGVLTTLIFWFFELSFNYFFANVYAKYVGALIGLSIGYVTKYNLDKRFVFNER